MNTRRFVLHLIVGLLAFLIGVTAAIALGGFDPLERLNRSYSRRQYTIPPQPLSDSSTMTERNYSCPHAHPRTADLRYRLEPPDPPAPVAPVEQQARPLFEDDVPPPPRAPRPRQ